MRLTMLSNFQTLHVLPSRVSLVFHFTAWARMDTYTASHYAARPPRPKLWSKSVWGWGVPFQIAIFLDKNAVRSETNDAPTKNIAAKATTCLRRGRVRIKCMSMNKCSIHCTSISQKKGLAQEVPYSSRTCSVYIRKYRQQVARCSPIQQSFEKLGAFRKHIVSSDQRSKNAVYQYAVRCVFLHSFQKFKILCEGAASTLRAYVYNAAFLQRGICILFRTYSSIIMRSIPLVQCTYTHIRKKEREREIYIYI